MLVILGKYFLLYLFIWEIVFYILYINVWFVNNEVKSFCEIIGK